jgi:hypothetical protein
MFDLDLDLDFDSDDLALELERDALLDAMLARATDRAWPAPRCVALAAAILIECQTVAWGRRTHLAKREHRRAKLRSLGRAVSALGRRRAVMRARLGAWRHPRYVEFVRHFISADRSRKISSRVF